MLRANSPNGFNADLNTLLNSSDTSVPGSTYKGFCLLLVEFIDHADAWRRPLRKIVFIPSTDQSWTPVADPSTSLQIGWQPTQVIQNSHSITDPNTRWNAMRRMTMGRTIMD